MARLWKAFFIPALLEFYRYYNLKTTEWLSLYLIWFFSEDINVFFSYLKSYTLIREYNSFT
jgi:hypothetical protein